jgi:hypothetical protein
MYDFGNGVDAEEVKKTHHSGSSNTFCYWTAKRIGYQYMYMSLLAYKGNKVHH